MGSSPPAWQFYGRDRLSFNRWPAAITESRQTGPAPASVGCVVAHNSSLPLLRGGFPVLSSRCELRTGATARPLRRLMSRNYAKVSPRLWTGRLGKSIRGDQATQIVAFYLVTNPHANLVGLYHLPLEYIAVDTGLEIASVEGAIERLAKLEFVAYDDANDRVWVVEHARHEFNGQQPLRGSGDKRLIAVERELAEHGISPLADRFRAHYRELAAMPLRCPSDAPPPVSEAPSKSGSGSGSGTGTGTGTPETTKEAKEVLLFRFPTRVSARQKATSWDLRADKVEEWVDAFPDVDVGLELRSALQWLGDNPTKRKTASGMTRFLGGWLRRAMIAATAQTTRPPPPGPSTGITKPYRDHLRRKDGDDDEK